MAESTTPRRSLWHWCRCSFRWCRIAILAAILLVLALLTWLRIAGLPDFVRLRIVGELARRGVAANFRSLHFHWFRGFVAEDLRVSWGGTNGTRITIDEADLDLAPPPWRERDDLVRGLAVRRGTLVHTLQVEGEPPRDLQVENITADLRFAPGNAWEIRRLAAQILGLQLELRANLTNLAGLRRPRPSPDPAAGAQRTRVLRNVVEEIEKWRFPVPPRLAANLSLDGHQPWAAHGDVYLDIPQIQTPHGSLRQFRMSVRIPPTPEIHDGDGRAASSAILEIGEIQSARGGLTGLTGRIDIDGPPRPALPTHAQWQFGVEHLFVRGLRARNLRASGTNTLLAAPAGPGPAEFASLPLHTRLAARAAHLEVAPTPTEPWTTTNVTIELEARHGPAITRLPEQVAFTLDLESLAGARGSATRALLVGDLRRRADEDTPAPAEAAGWAALWPLAGRVSADMTGLHLQKLDLDRACLVADWQPPNLILTNLTASLQGGDLQADGSLDTVSRAAAVQVLTTFDLHAIDPFLGPRSLENFRRYQWRQPPWFQARASAILPAWTDRHPDWDATVKPTLRVDGRFRVDHGSFKGIPFDHAESSLRFDGAYWRLPDLRTRRPEGSQEIAVEYHDDTREYRIDASGIVHPPVLEPVLGEKSAEVLRLFEFEAPAAARVSVWGPWTEGDRQSVVGTFEATNVVFRGQRFDQVTTRMVYTNRFLVGTPVHLVRDGRHLHAEGVGYSFAEDRLWLTNTVSTIDPAVVAAAISPEFPEKLRPYQFEQPPEVRVEGTIQPRRQGTAELTFDIAGGPFRFWRLSSPVIRSRLLWQGSTLTLTNIQAEFYRGSLTGEAFFDLADPEDGRYRFHAVVDQASLGDLLREATLGRTNVAEGIVHLDLTVDSARTADLRSWNGRGRAELRDGLLWDAPIFGFLSPVLNALVPGLGNNRAERAEANFTLTNSVIHTRDLVITCPPAKLLYRGTLDFDQRVEAKVEAQVLSDLVGFGPLLGLILRPLTKLMEFKVTGTLADVNAEPLYVPKVLLLPLQPLKILRSLFQIGESRAGPGPETNAPPASPDPPSAR